jgi:tetratricopeptide (TPR) repeat protein
MEAALADVPGQAVPGAGRFRVGWPTWTAAAVLVVAIAAGLTWRASGPPVGHISRVAVMPFQTSPTDQGAAYLADSVPRELTSLVGQIGAIKVIPWTYMRRFDAASPPTLTDVANRTGADAVVQGFVQRVPNAAGEAGQSVQVNVEVFHAATGAMLWRSSFRRDIGDFFALQAAIARELAGRINVVLGRREEMLLAKSRHVSADAMQDYLKARERLELDMDLRAAITLFLQAIEKEPQFAEAYAGLSSCYALESAYFGMVPSDVAFERAAAASNRAIDIDPELAEGWSTRAFARFTLEWNWAGAEADFRRALELGPESVGVLQDYSNYLADRGRHDEAIAAARRAEDRSPLSAQSSRAVGWALYMAHRYDEAIQQLRHALEIEPEHVPSHTLLGRALMLAGREAEGLQELQRPGTNLLMLAAAHAQAGNRVDALRILDEARAPGASRPANPYHVALVHVALGDAASALDSLEQAYRERASALVAMGVDPMLDPIRAEPRFQALMAQMNLP